MPSRKCRGAVPRVAALAALLIGACWAGDLPAAPFVGRPYRDDRILILPKPGRAAALADLHRNETAKVWRMYPALGGIQVLAVPPGTDIPALVQRYRQSGLVEAAEPDHIVHAAASPNDPALSAGLQWGLFNNGTNGGTPRADIHAPEGWNVLASASNIIAAILDSGVRYTHTDLAANMWVNPGEIPGDNLDNDHNGYIDDIYGINTFAGNSNPTDDFGHGTRLAGIVGAVGNNGIGIAGVAWTVKIMACRFMDNLGNGSYSDAIEAVNYARNNGARIINASFVDTEFNVLFFTALQACRNAGIIIVAAAGNAGSDNDVTPYYPASFNLDNILAVTASTRTDTLAPGVNYGATSVDLAAPGTEIYSTVSFSDTSYSTDSGTSYAAPHVAGVLALMLAKFPSATYRQTIDRLLTSVDRLPSLSGRCVTGGRINLFKALAHWPPELEPVATAPTNQFQIILSGEPQTPYALEFSTNLNSWRAVTTNSTTGAGTATFIQTNAPSPSGRFYRARLVQ